MSVEAEDSPLPTTPSTPTKKRATRLAAKPQLELIDEIGRVSFLFKYLVLDSTIFYLMLFDVLKLFLNQIEFTNLRILFTLVTNLCTLV